MYPKTIESSAAARSSATELSGSAGEAATSERAVFEATCRGGDAAHADQKLPPFHRRPSRGKRKFHAYFEESGVASDAKDDHGPGE